MKSLINISILVSFLFLIACSQKSSYAFLQQISPTETSVFYPKAERGNCQAIEHYIPDTLSMAASPMRYIRVNCHFVDNAKGTVNFKGNDARIFARSFLDIANKNLRENKKMRLPVGNETPALPPQYQYVLTGKENTPSDDGIYFHKSDLFYFHNKKDKGVKSKERTAIFDELGVRKGEVLNIFFVEHPTDSIASPTYKPSSDGVGYSKWCKIVASYDIHKDNPDIAIDELPKYLVGILNHEIGHTLGLAHTWRGNDGCDDTPKNNNCWNYKQGRDCDSWNLISNNMMDYNAFRHAISPCQIGKIQQRFIQNKTQRALLEPVWCTYKESASVRITRHETWQGAKDLEGDILIQNGASLRIQCVVNLPRKARIIIQPKGKLILDGGTLRNDCAEEWEGILIYEKGKNKGSVELLNGGTIADERKKIEVL